MKMRQRKRRRLLKQRRERQKLYEAAGALQRTGVRSRRDVKLVEHLVAQLDAGAFDHMRLPMPDVVARRLRQLEDEVTQGLRDARSLVAIPKELARGAELHFPSHAYGKPKRWDEVKPLTAERVRQMPKR